MREKGVGKNMIREWIEVRNSDGDLIDRIPILPKITGRGAKARDEEIKENDIKLRRHIGYGMQVMKKYEDTEGNLQ